MTGGEQAQSGAHLVFVYNAGSSPLNQVLDLLHKAVSPETYSCNLCRVTYGAFAARKEWTEFIKSLPYQVVFLHKDEFHKRYSGLGATPLPAVFQEREGGVVKPLVSAEEIHHVRSVEQMKSLLLSKLAVSAR